MPSVKSQLIQTREKIEESYLRDKEKEKIIHFLKSKEKILHIAGNPGTGKTNTVKFILYDYKYTYINHLVDNHPKKFEKIIVYDEFDKFYHNRNSQCLNFIKKHRNKKLITISNDLLFHQNSLLFKPYTNDEISYIIQKKLNTDRISDLVLNYISIQEKNDLRRVLNVCSNLLKVKKTSITIQDLIAPNKKRDSIHQQLIHEMKNIHGEKNKVFIGYKSKCKELKIKELDRIDFTAVFENIE